MVKRLLKYWPVALLLLGGVSCDQEFSPKSDFQEQVVVYAVASVVRPIGSRAYTQSITAVVMRSFDVVGANPAGSTVDPSIRGAIVCVSSGGRADTLRERRRPGVDSLTGIGPRWYYTGSSVPGWPTLETILTVDLPDGRRLTARTRAPFREEPTTFPVLFGLGMSTPSNDYIYGTSWIFDWSSAPGDQHLFFPLLYLMYERWEDTGYVAYSREVPVKMVNKGGKMVPEHPGVITTSKVDFAFSAMDATMAAISEGDPQKSRYRILRFRWQFTEYDFPLSRYYSSVNGYMDAYSVRLDETVFSNISGGIGVFGSAFGYSVDYAIDPRYAEEFGYTSP